MSVSLNRVRVEHYLMASGNLAYCLEGLYRADLVVGSHYRDKNGIIPDCCLKCFGMDKSVFVAGKICHCKAFGFERSA